ncbi:hypothetical protein GUITHDRAFT_98901 [Guillardia theta CCMP2712]|uniref:Uncharacterized protein n=1 Tax=Guillardia theta (strain CCMP2712) TaxID=905079 RepID=L1K2R2_GUITC|nr:hypothetical protein GUITHDRAFT_98901 [Guillardia theta CCMP2712]EKX55116.1 hypothetical protein GUITHDRAFT_98901 [Guillardia theta CCMP2712]|eukprot:XP_005842096.1 hypothetical protein GUITHDRAFT_98901 [Guillardia theta CCMP2712]
MVLQYDESVRNLLYRRSCQYTQGERSGGHVEEAADLVEKVKSFTKRYPNSRTAYACRAEGGCTPDAIAEAIRSTCRQARRDLFEDSLSEWSSESRAWFIQQMEEAKKQNVETYIGTEGTEGTSFISMTLLGISSMFVRQEEKLKSKLMELDLMVDSVDGVDKAIMWKAPYRPEIARADDISVTVSFLRNEAAMELWEGRREYTIDGRSFRATEVSIAHDRSFKLRAKRGPWGKGGWKQRRQEELLAGKPISLELDKSVGKLHDTFCSPGNVEFMTLGAWAATPTLGSKRNMLKEKLRAYLGEQRWTRVQGNKAARRGSAFSPRAAATDALEQEAESDDIESRSVSLLFLAISKFAEHHGLSCTGKVDKQDRLRLMMREEVDMEAEEGEGVEEEAGAGLSRA